MAVPIPGYEESIRALEDACGRMTALLEKTPASAPAIGDWNAGDLGTHLKHLFALYPDLIAGKSSPVPDHLDMTGYWRSVLEGDSERDPAAAAAAIRRHAEAFTAAATEENWLSDVTWHGGVQIPVYALASVLINESEIHGMDLAHSNGGEWTITREAAVLIFEGHLPILPAYLNKEASADLDAIFEVKLRGGPTIYVLVDHGDLEIRDDKPRRVDCRISADPVSYLLTGYGRVGKWKPILTGKIAAYGRKPWLGLRFPNLFHSV